MSDKPLVPYMKAIETVKEKFIASAGDLLQYDKESIFAMQLIGKNEFSIRVANDNPASVQLAMRNVAATGLTLNPAYGYAYLVPRDGAIVLDISFKGLIKIATDCGAIMWARADVVYATDQFTYRGPATAPDVVSDPFNKEKGEIVGAYCIAKTREGDILTEVLPIDDLEKIRSKSELFKKKGSGPWVEFFGQMCKKSAVKRAAKTWPYTGRSGRLYEAMELASESEGGYTFDSDVHKKGALEGVWEAIPEERKEVLRKIAATTREYFEADDLTGMVDYVERSGLDGIEEEAALWTQLPSSVRSAFKTAQATVRKLGVDRG